MRIGVYFGKNIYTGACSGGAYTFAQSILDALKNYQGKHSFFIFSDDCKDEKIGNINFVKLNRYYSLPDENFLKKLLFKIPRKIKRLKFEKQYFNALNKAVLEKNIELMWFATPAYEFTQIPFVYTVWDLQHRLQPYFPEVSVAGCKFEDRERFYNSIIPRAAYIIIGNEAGKNDLICFYGVPDFRVKTVTMPISDFFLNTKNYPKIDIKKTNNPSPGLRITNKILGNYLFYPAQFWPHKNHIVILLALKILKQKYDLDFEIVFTGSDKGNLNYIKEKTKELNLQNKAHFLNFVPVEDLVSLYQNAFALVFPSFFGPDNIPPLEAFALECPVIAANVDGAQYQLKDAVLLFDPKNENDLANQIKKLNDDKNLKNDLIKKGKNRIQNMTSDCYLKEIEKIIDEFEPIRRCWSSKNKYVHL